MTLGVGGSAAPRWVSPPIADITCSHCELPVPASRVQLGAELQFCCDGCASVYGLLRGAELTAYYDVREKLGGRTERALVTKRTYEDFDDDALQDLLVERWSSNLSRVDLHLEGLHCGACVWLVEKVCSRVPGVREARVDLGRRRLTVAFDPQELKLSALARRLDSFGYPCHANVGDHAGSEVREEDRKLLVRMGVAAAAAGNAMLMAFALYSGLASGLDRDLWSLFRWGSLAVTIPAVFWSAVPFFQRAIAAVRARTVHMDIPISLAIGSGFIWGAINTVRGAGEIYFDTLGVLTFLLLVGRYIQQKSQRRSLDEASLLQSLAPSSARMVTADGVKEVPIARVPVGAVVIVQAGDVLPVDGTVISGESSLNLALLTGESLPAEVRPGEQVYAGTLNLERELRIQATASGQSTRVGQLVRSLEQSALLRPKVALLADQVAGYFVVLVTLLALITLLLWWPTSPEHAVENAIALLVVSCPCALAMATPLAISSALGRAARAGILIKSGEAVERLARAQHVVFDKTGTLTEGRLELAAWWGDVDLKPVVQALEREATHPVGRALSAGLPSDARIGIEHLQTTLGSGVEGELAGRKIRVGKPSFVLGSRDVPEASRAFVEEQRRLGRSLLAVSVDGEVRALLSLAERVRADTSVAIRELKKLGLRLSLLSGDQQRAVDSVSEYLGNPFTEARGEVSPEGKRDALSLYGKAEHAVMVGDGVNDAGALVAASVGVAVHGGAEASLKVADVFITQEGLAPLVTLFTGARRTLTVIRRGMVFSLLYNVVSISLAMSGRLSPLVAAILMPLSSITVVLNAYRSRTF